MSFISSCQVAVIGAGLAGLVAADLLKERGIDVKVFEASNRAGGRVLTQYWPSGAHCELGAFSFSDAETTIWKYIQRFALKAISHSSIDREFQYEGEKSRFSDKAISLLGKKTDVQYSQLMGHFQERLSMDGEDVSFAEGLRKVDASDKTIRWLEKHTLAGLLGDGFDSVSLHAALSYIGQYHGSKQFYALEGGNELLPQAMAKGLEGKIFYNFPISRVDRFATSWLLQGPGRRQVVAQRIIFALPATAVKQIEIFPPLPQEKQHALSEVRYTSCSRITVLTQRNETPRGGVFAMTEQPAGWLRDQSAFQKSPAQRNVYNLSLVGKGARDIKKEPQEAQKQKICVQLNAFGQRVAVDSAEIHFHSWDDEQWIKGGYSYFSPGSFHYQEEVKKAEGSLHFCGEHTSDKFASMNGALESGIRAANEVLSAMKA